MDGEMEVSTEEGIGMGEELQSGDIEVVDERVFGLERDGEELEGEGRSRDIGGETPKTSD